VSLTTGRGPLSPDPAGRFSPPIPSAVTYVEPFHRRVRALLGGATVLDSERVLLVHRPGRPPTFAFPVADVRSIVGAAVAGLPDHVTIAWDAVDAWYEEDELVRGHPRNPYHRVDYVRTSRRLQVNVRGVPLVDTTKTIGAYETGLAPKLYVHRASVRTDLLMRSNTTTYCPYKGTATWWSATVGDAVVDDVAWSYDDPLPESLTIRDMLSFDGQRADVIADLPPGA
jgi:uncharacterized protein (DUF427 family)